MSEQKAKPLWTDGQIEAYAEENARGAYTRTCVRRGMHRVQMDMQAKLDAANARIAELEAEAGAGWEPDWSIAPEWAMYWAVDASGDVCWLELEPYIYSGFTAWSNGSKGGVHAIGEWGRINLPIGVDWRTTLRKRPSEATP